MKKKNLVPAIMLLISFSGFSVFYLFPFMLSAVYAFTDNPINFNFVGFQNFVEIFNNKYFRLGLKNTSLFILISIPLNITLSLVVALIVSKLKIFSNIFSLVFLVPLVIPSATTAFFWSNLFAVNGLVNEWFNLTIDWFKSDYGMFVIILIFLWKNIGYNMALFIGGLCGIPTEYYEVAQMSGANRFQTFRHVTLVYLTPTFFLTLIMSFINSFKIFKEIYIITGETPHNSLYTLQHYVNSTFHSLNYQKMVSATYVLTVIVVLFVSVVFRSENRLSRDLRRLT